VYPKSPAEAAGIKEGDRIIKVGPNAPARGGAPVPGGGLIPITGGRAQLGQLVRGFPVNTELKVEVKRKDGGKTEQVVLKVGSLNEELPEKLPMPSSKLRALEKPKAPAPGKPGEAEVEIKPGGKPEKKEDDKKEEKKEDDKKDADEFEKGLLTGLSNKTSGREYWMYLPDNYDRNKSYGVVIWLHAAKPGANEAKDMKKIWEDYCDAANFIIIAPKSKGQQWASTETEDVILTVREALKPYTIDPARVVVHGMGIGGSMGLYMAFNARDFVRGVAVSGAPLAGNAKDNLPNQPLSFFLIAGDKDPLLKEIQDTTTKLKAKKFPLIYREIADFGKQYIDQKTLDELTVWLDSMDRI
jgi:serine protease Do